MAPALWLTIMIRPIAIVLLIMGGGTLISGLVLHQRNRECQAARAAGLANAEQICNRAIVRTSGRGGGYYGNNWRHSRSWFSSSAIAGAVVGRSASRPAQGTVSRGGFGRSGGFFSSGG